MLETQFMFEKTYKKIIGNIALVLCISDVNRAAYAAARGSVRPRRAARRTFFPNFAACRAAPRIPKF